MSYEHKSNVYTNSLYKRFGVLGIFTLIFILVFLIFPNFIKNTFAYIVGPLWSLEKQIFGDDIPESSILHDQVINELQSENDKLKSSFNNINNKDTGILVYIIKKPPFTAYDSYIVDISNTDGISIGDRVYNIDNVLLGEIEEINANLAKVKLFSSHDEKFNVSIGKNNIQTIATGQGGGYFEVVLPKDSKININDTVSALENNISILGYVKDIEIDPARAFSTVLISSSINIYEQKWLIIHKKSNNESKGK